MYLPGEQRDDIIRELEENLRSQIDEREADLGRSLTEPEQEAVLLAHGNPIDVAGRYGVRHRSVAFGRQLIGPEMFPLYIRVLLGNWIVSGIVHAGIAVSKPDAREPLPFFFSAGVQFVLITVIFSVVDFLQRRSRLGVELDRAGRSWRFPPAYLQQIPRWQSQAGFFAWLLLTVWWAALPSNPVLLIGTRASTVHYSAPWSTFYWPVLFLFVAGMVQRAVNYVHPEWNWLPPVVRLGVNSIALALVYPMHLAYPYFVATPGTGASGELFARGLNFGVWWTIVAGFGLFYVTQIAMNGWLCLLHARYLRRQRQEHLS